MKSLVIGAGQIGNALHTIFQKAHESYLRDVDAIATPKIDVLHIAYPYSDKFVETVREYQRAYAPRLTMIHSSVAIGTTRSLGAGYVHSPERGRHPNLAFEMIRFPKFVGGIAEADVIYAKEFFERCHWSTIGCNNPDVTEALKLISNAHLGIEIAWRQFVNDIIPNETRLYDYWEDSYNRGHFNLGHKQLIRSRMDPHAIGGHCILPCTEMLNETHPNDIFEWVKTTNEKRQAKERASYEQLSDARETEAVRV